MANTPQNIYQAIEQALKGADAPVTCVELFDKPEIRKQAADANKVSDALGNLWRRGYLTRYPAPKVYGSQARYAYAWRPPRRVLRPQELEAMQAKAFDAQPRDPIVSAPMGDPRRDQRRPDAGKPTVAIREEGEVLVVELPQITLTIKTR